MEGRGDYAVGLEGHVGLGEVLGVKEGKEWTSNTRSVTETGVD